MLDGCSDVFTAGFTHAGQTIDDEAVAVRGLVKRYGLLTAVDRLSFTVRRGEIFGLLGPNGAGKTTTIRILITLTRPTAGEAYVAGYPVAASPVEVKKRIGVVPQQNNLERELTGRENLPTVQGKARSCGVWPVS